MLVIKNLRDTVEEQQERLTIHKIEIATLQKTVATLESRLASVEKLAANRPMLDVPKQPELSADARSSQDSVNALGR